MGGVVPVGADLERVVGEGTCGDAFPDDLGDGGHAFGGADSVGEGEVHFPADLAGAGADVAEAGGGVGEDGGGGEVSGFEGFVPIAGEEGC